MNLRHGGKITAEQVSWLQDLGKPSLCWWAPAVCGESNETQQQLGAEGLPSTPRG